MLDTFLYLSFPHKFDIAVINSGVYVNGMYYFMQADQFLNETTQNIYMHLLFEDNEPKPKYLRNCKSCKQYCHNLTVYKDCCSYEPMLGLV